MMLKSFLRSLAVSNKLQRAAPGSSLTFYHNPMSGFSVSLFERLSGYSGMPCTKNKYDGSGPVTRWSQGRSSAYGRQMPQSAGTDVQTKFGIELKENRQLTYDDYLFISQNCADIHPDNKKILQKMLGTQAAYHLEPLSPDAYKELISNRPNTSPLVIDYDNCLIANDDKTFDRIMSNYSSCGIQNFGHQKSSVDKKFKYREVVHPHVAEFADLY